MSETLLSKFIFMTLVIFCAGCGIKGKPLPPLQATTQQLNETEPAVKEKKK